MTKKKRNIFTKFGMHITSTVSVGLVLLVLGIVGALAIATRNISDTIKENLGFNLILTSEATTQEVNELKQLFARAPYVADFEYLSADNILAQEEDLLQCDIVEILGVNPYQDEFNVHVKANWANNDSINAIVEPLRNIQSVDTVTVHTEMVEDINTNISTITLILLAVALALLLVSFVLINNTVRLTIYSRRFLIHTMRLVGATGGFIRRPIVIGNIINGLIAAFIAILLLCLLCIYVAGIDPDIAASLPWSDLIPVFGLLIICGMLICALASIFATNKHLRQDYDNLF